MAGRWTKYAQIQIEVSKGLSQLKRLDEPSTFLMATIDRSACIGLYITASGTEILAA
jgi:hypothetical protein